MPQAALSVTVAAKVLQQVQEAWPCLAKSPLSAVHGSPRAVQLRVSHKNLYHLERLLAEGRAAVVAVSNVVILEAPCDTAAGVG